MALPDFLLGSEVVAVDHVSLPAFMSGTSIAAHSSLCTSSIEIGVNPELEQVADVQAEEICDLPQIFDLHPPFTR